jgi:hypothetical protein
MCAYIRFNIHKETGVKLDNEQWHKHTPKLVEANPESKVTVLPNQQLQTDRTIHNDKPDIIIPDSEERTCTLIGIEISGDRNVIKK